MKTFSTKSAVNNSDHPPVAVSAVFFFFLKQCKLPVIFLVTALPLKLFAQAPTLSYSTPQTYVIGTAIAALAPTSSGVAAAGYSSSPVTIGSGFNGPEGVAVDASGNVYVADFYNNAVKKIPTGGGVPITIGSGFLNPAAVAVDVLGNVYVADHGHNLVKEIPLGVGTPVTIGSGFSAPTGVAVDVLGNVYVADYGNSLVKEIPVGGGTPVTLGTGFSLPTGVAVDVAGNVYVADQGNNAIQKIPKGGGTLVTLGSGFSFPNGVAVDAAGNVYVADKNNNAVKEIPLANGGPLTPISIGGLGFGFPNGVATDAAGNMYVADYGNNAVKEIKPVGGYYLSLSLPAGLSFNGVTGVISGTPTALSPATNYVVTAYNALGGSSATINIGVSALIVSYSSPQTYVIGTAIAPLSPAITGVVAAAGYSTSTAIIGSGFNNPDGVAVDAAGNVYVADFYNNAVKKIPAGGGSPVIIGSGFSLPTGVAVDAAGNIYVADNGNNDVKKIPSGGDTPVVIGSGFTGLNGIAVDVLGNVYVTENFRGTPPEQSTFVVMEIPIASGTPVTLSTAFSLPTGVAVDAAGNVYVADEGAGTVDKIPAGGGAPVTLSSGFNTPFGVAVDAAGNVYVGDYNNKPVNEIPAGGGTPISIGSGFNEPMGVAVDGAGNVYVADAGNNLVKEIKPIGGYYIGPFLPNGLSFNNSTGAISGTPIAISPATNYTVTAYNASGSGANTVNIKVAASTVATLSNLTLSDCTLSPVFATGTTSYTAGAGNATTSITVTPTTADPTATVTVNGVAVTSGTTSAAIPLVVGSNPITTVVTAQDGTTTETYTVTVTRAPSVVATLSSLKTSKGTFSPAFSSTKTSYAGSVVNGVTSITITPTASDPTATIKVNGAVVASGSASQTLPLVVGANSFNTKVTAQDGTTIIIYTLVITRGPSANDYLSNLKPSAGSLSPTFSASRLAYTEDVVNGAATITITPFTAVPTSTVKVNGITVASGTASAPIALNAGLNAITTVVTAQDGATTRTYTLTVTRAPSANANLSAFKISKGTLTPAFATGTTTYTANVVNGVTLLTVTPTASDVTAAITVNGNAVPSGSASGAIVLAVGSNTITALVTAQDGTTTKTYTLTVTRASGGADSYVPIAICTGISVTKPTATLTLADDGIVVHQALSPNGDGINDFLQIDNIGQYPDNKLSIMDRNGQLVYEANGYDNSSKVFDGRSNKNGRMQLPGTYFYQLDYTVSGLTKHKTGFLVLKY